MNSTQYPYFPRLIGSYTTLAYGLVAVFAFVWAFRMSSVACLLLFASCLAGAMAFATVATVREATLRGPNLDWPPEPGLSGRHVEACRNLFRSALMDDEEADAQAWYMTLFQFYCALGVIAGFAGFVSGVTEHTVASLGVGVGCALNAWVLAMACTMGDLTGAGDFALLSNAEIAELATIASGDEGLSNPNPAVSAWLAERRAAVPLLRKFNLALARNVKREATYALAASPASDQSRVAALAKLVAVAEEGAGPLSGTANGSEPRADL